MDDKDPKANSGQLEVIGVSPLRGILHHLHWTTTNNYETGLPRTGTLSLCTALEILGYSPCHYSKTNVVDKGFPYHESRLWQQACKEQDAEKRRRILHQIYEESGCRAAVDYRL